MYAIETGRWGDLFWSEEIFLHSLLEVLEDAMACPSLVVVVDRHVLTDFCCPT
jgi:hypothetical protein